GGGGTNSLLVDDRGNNAAATYTLAAGSVQRTGSGGVTYTGIQSATVSGGSGGNAFVVAAAPTTTTVTLNGGSGTNPLTGPNAATTWTVNGTGSGTLGSKVLFNAMHDLIGGSAKDTFKFTGAGNIPGTVNGGGGSADKLDYSALAGPVTVNLQNAS